MTELEPRPASAPPVPPRVHLVDDAVGGARRAADAVARALAQAAAEGRRCVLGLATGATMRGVYAELVRRHDEEGLSFAHAETFNLDEYLGLAPDDPRTFASEMRRALFDRVDVDPSRAHVPDPLAAEHDPAGYAREWERRIEDAGGLDVQLLGVGRNGHLAFNEPGSSHSSRTRLVELDEVTRADAAAAFGGLDRVPRRAVTAGLATILAARRLRVLALGPAKARAVAAALEGPVDDACPASALRLHSDVDVWLDADAAARLEGDAHRRR